MKNYIVACLLLLTSAAYSSEPAFRRWAVIASPELQRAGVSDLLFAELSSKSIELVEREELATVTKEIELTKLLGADAAPNRLKVGKLAKADALVLLSVVEHEKQKSMKLVISDCKYGSRLRLEHWPLDAQAATSLAGDAAQEVLATQARFADGIAYWVAVPPFISKSFSVEYAHHQWGFAALLADSLMQRRGVAVVEFEEARSIREELALGADKIEARQRVLTVEGEFDIRREKAQGDESAKVSLKTTDGNQQSKELNREFKALTTAVQWLRRLSLDELRSQDAAREEIPAETVNAQEKRLIARADSFVQIGAYAEAAALREAVLLMNDANWEQRVLALSDYAGQIDARLQQWSPPGNTRPLLAMAKDRAFRDRVVETIRPMRRSQLHHLERLIADRTLNAFEASLLCRLVGPTESAEYWVPLSKGELDSDWTERCWAIWEQFKLLDEPKRDDVVHPAVRRSTREFREGRHLAPYGLYQAWVPAVFTLITMTLPGRLNGTGAWVFDDSQALSHLDRFMNRVLDPERLAGTMVHSLMFDTLPSLVKSKRIAIVDVETLFRKWQADPRQTVSFYGRMGLLGLKASGVYAERVTQKDIDNLKSLEADILTWGKRSPKALREASVAISALLGPTYKLNVALQAGGRTSTRPNPQTITGGSDPAPKVMFEPLMPLTGDWRALVRCNDKLDLFWSRNAVGILREPFKPEILWRSKFDEDNAKRLDQDMVFSATCDGDVVWIASASSGIQVFDLSGKKVGQLAPEGWGLNEAVTLPETERLVVWGREALQLSLNASLWLYAIEPGRCFVMGSAGKERRWFGVIERTKGDKGWRFEKWHETQPQANAGENSRSNPADAFTPTLFVDYLDPHTKARTFLFGRPTSTPVAQSGVAPLAFDIEARKASVFRHPISLGMGGPTLPLVHDGQILNVLYPPTRAVPLKDGGFELIPILRPIPRTATEVDTRPIARPRLSFGRDYAQLIEQGGVIYQPNGRWRRLDPQIWEAPYLCESLPSPRFEFEHYAVSAHHGLVAWNYKDTVHRVHLETQKRESHPVDWLYPFMPEAERERHHRAVLALRQLGAEVDSLPKYLSWQGDVRTTSWRTGVCLLPNWTGGDAGLRHLKDLHQLGDFVASQAEITDAGVSELEGIQSLEFVALAETKVTSQGVSRLAALPMLKNLWLDDRTDGERLSDAAITAFEKHRSLQRVTLCGAGFGDGSIKVLERMVFLNWLQLYETNFSPAGLAQLKKQRPGLPLIAQ